MDEYLRNFLRVGLSAEGAAALQETRDGLPFEPADKVASLRLNLRSLIERRELSLQEWAMMSDFDFDTEDDLYGYLESVYQYLFEDAETPPEPPF